MSWQRKVGAAIVALVAFAALLSLVWTPYDPLQTEVAVRLQGTSASHWMGTDQFGRDILSRVMDGARLTLTVAVGAVALSGLVGVPLGIWAGMRRSASRVVMAGADLLLAFPALLLAIVFTAVFGASIWIVVLAIGIAGIPAFVRVARAGTMQVMQHDYILAARIAKVSGPAIAWRHVLPNIWPLVLAILAEAGLSFLGLGAPAPYASWGRMLQASQPYLATSPHLALWPGAAIALTVLGFNLLGHADDRR